MVIDPMDFSACFLHMKSLENEILELTGMQFSDRCNSLNGTIVYNRYTTSLTMYRA